MAQQNGLQQLGDLAVRLSRSKSSTLLATAAAALTLACWWTASLAGSARRRRSNQHAQRRPKRVLILGGSFAGAEVAKKLEASAWEGYCDVELIDTSGILEFTPAVLAVIAGAQGVRAIRRDLVLLLPRATVVTGSVVSVDVAERRVRTADGTERGYDYLVVATGSSYTTPIKHEPELAAESSREEQLQGSADAVRSAKHIVVVGGGVVGVELAADLASYAESPRSCTITLVTSSATLLPTSPEKAGRYAAQSLEQLGVRVIYGERTTKQKGSNRQELVCSKSGEVLPCNLCYWCIGGRPNSGFVEDKTLLDKHGRLKVDPQRLRLPGHPEVFAVGDVASKDPSQYLASYAHWEAEYTASVIARKCRDADAIESAYSAPAQFLAISLGASDGMLLVNGRMWLGGGGLGVTALLVRPIKRIIQWGTLGFPFRAGISINPYWLLKWWAANEPQPAAVK